MYSPKDDQKHRTLWRELYNSDEAKQLSILIESCKQHKIRFVYSVGPGLDIKYSDRSEIDHLTKKLLQVFDLGCTDFAILFDDISNELQEADKKVFNSFAEAQCHVTNAAYLGLREKLGTSFGRLFFCPTEYCGRIAKPNVLESEYLNTIGKKLNPSIDFFWTGPEIISTFISVESIKQLQSVINRKPTIWDNLHANDYDIRRVYLGPFDGRPLELRNEVIGILSNPNCEYEANFVPFRTLAIYANSTTYDPLEALKIAIQDWSSLFVSNKASHPIEISDVELLCDLFYLPYKYGK